MRTLVGVGLLLFGLGWLYKAILRSTGLKALHDEGEIYAETQEELMTHGHAFGTAFGGVFLEGLEVVFIVVALGGLNSLPSASIGAGLSLIVVVVAGFVARRPLTRVPENTVKYAVGVMLTSFGTFFAGEGLGVSWWNGDIVLLPLIAIYTVASVVLVQYIKRQPRLPVMAWPLIRWLRAGILEVWGLIVTDGMLAIAAIAALLFVSLFVDRFRGSRGVAGPILVTGVIFAIVLAVRGAVQASARRLAARPAPSASRLAESSVGERV
jgi:Ca2+/H+ antiporter, TMEM165/GDT1 family